jgi:hypothetical protein
VCALFVLLNDLSHFFGFGFGFGFVIVIVAQLRGATCVAKSEVGYGNRQSQQLQIEY